MEKYRYEKNEFSLMENSPIPLAVYQYMDGRVVTLVLSAGLLDLFGIADMEDVYNVIDKDRYRYCHPDDIAMLEESAVLFATKDEPYNVVYRSKVKDKWRLIHAFGKHIQKGETRLAIVWYVDEGEFHENDAFSGNYLNSAFSNLIQTNNAARVLQYDFLTGLPTIGHFFYLAETNFYKKAEERGENPVMLFFDLNGMRHYNAKFGFAEGDKLIRAFSRLLVETFSNDCCSRFGSDRFCVFSTDKDLEERLWQLFSDAEGMNGGRSVPVRAGIYPSSVEKCGASLACDRAKMACDSSRTLYLSHFTYFDKSMLQEAENRQYIVDNIDRAIKEGWIKVYYQPIVRAANGRVCDEEALARWIDPQKGFLSPADFIPILEDANLIYKLDLYMTEEILKKMKAQEAAGLYLAPISVNLSRSDFDTCDIVAEIYKRVLASGLPPSKLTIEITESIIGSDYEYMKTQIKRFQDLGFSVWMDDFGSGYSSLEVLHDIPFNLIKFDMKFMQQFSENEKSRVILAGMMKVAAELGIDTICEGVETEEQVEFLKEVGCTKLQGYYYCKPIPLEKIFERYEKGEQIGFENPAETGYYASLGRINLYDLSVVTNSDDEMFNHVFNTLPMAILEDNNDRLKIVRGNKSYKDFLRKHLDEIMVGKSADEQDGQESVFLSAVRKCRNVPAPVIIDEPLSSGLKIHAYIRRIAVNPITGVVAIVVVVIGITKD